MAEGPAASRRCPNCDAGGVDRFCPECGQRVGDELVPSLRSWLGEAADELLLVEARLPRTLGALWPPGRLTGEWWEGRRARYVSPLRLYLLAAVPFFLVVSVNTSDWFEGAGASSALGMVVALAYLEEEDSAFSARPLMEPLPAELQADTAARRAWSEAMERSRQEARDRAAERDRQIDAGIQRVFDLLPVLVGLLMVPYLAVLLWLALGRRSKLVAATVFSLHAHTVVMAFAGIGWIVGAPLLVGGTCGTIYTAAALRRLGRIGWPDAFFRGAIAIPVAYVVGFSACYYAVVRGLALSVPGLLFSS